MGRAFPNPQAKKASKNVRKKPKRLARRHKSMVLHSVLAHDVERFFSSPRSRQDKMSPPPSAGLPSSSASTNKAGASATASILPSYSSNEQEVLRKLITKPLVKVRVTGVHQMMAWWDLVFSASTAFFFGNGLPLPVSHHVPH
jgi:hypothetical protein